MRLELLGRLRPHTLALVGGVVCLVVLTVGPGLRRCVGAQAAGATTGRARPSAGARPSASAGLLREARRDFDAKRFAVASVKLEGLLKRMLPPNERTEAYVLLCESRLCQGQFALAESLAVGAKAAGGIGDKAALERLGFLKGEILYYSGDVKGATDEYISFLEDDIEGTLVNDALERLLLIDENTGSSPQPLAAYARAELAELAGAPDSALAILDGILRDPTSPPIADDALAKKADILRAMRRFPDAITQYRLVEVQFPQSRLVPRCKLNIAEIYASDMGEKETAVVECEEVARNFPGTSYAVEARAMLNSLAGGAEKGKK